MEVLDTTIVNVALPHIAGTMSASYDEATWTLTSYLVANGIVLPMSAYFSRCSAASATSSSASRVHRLLASCAASRRISWQLIIFRMLQGFFGGGLQPNQQSIILDTFPPAQRGRAFSISAVATVVAPVLGPTLGGWITDQLHVALGVSHQRAGRRDDDHRGDAVRRRPAVGKAAGRARRWASTYVGIGLIALGLGCLQVMLDRGEDDDWFSSNFIRTFAVLAAVGIVGAIVWLLREEAGGRSARAEGPQFRARLRRRSSASPSILYGSAVIDAATRAAATRLHRDARGPRAVARRDHASCCMIPHRQQADAVCADALPRGVRLLPDGDARLLYSHHARARHRLQDADEDAQRAVDRRSASCSCR